MNALVDFHPPTWSVNLTLVWLARPSQLHPGHLGAFWDGLASQTNLTPNLFPCMGKMIWALCSVQSLAVLFLILS